MQSAMKNAARVGMAERHVAQEYGRNRRVFLEKDWGDKVLGDKDVM